MLPMNPMINKDTQRVTVRGYDLLRVKDLFKVNLESTIPLNTRGE